MRSVLVKENYIPRFRDFSITKNPKCIIVVDKIWETIIGLNKIIFLLIYFEPNNMWRHPLENHSTFKNYWPGDTLITKNVLSIEWII